MQSTGDDLQGIVLMNTVQQQAASTATLRVTLPFIIITQNTQPKSLLYHPVEDERLSQPLHCIKGVQLHITVAVMINTTAYCEM